MKTLIGALCGLIVCFGQDALAEQEARLDALQKQATELYQAGKYAEGISVAQSALDLAENALGPAHPKTASSLNDLAVFFASQGENAKAEPLYQRALAIREKALGSEHPDTAETLHNLAMSYRAQRQYAKAEPLAERALAIFEKTLGRDHPDTAVPLYSLALVYDAQGQYAKAEPLYQRLLAIYEKARGPEHPLTAVALTELASTYTAQGQYAKAEPLFERSLAISEKTRGPEHMLTAMSLNSLASLYERQGRYSKAEPLYRRALAICEKARGPEHPETAVSLNNLANLYKEQGRYAEAEPLLLRALAINEKVQGLDDRDTATALSNLALLYEAEGQYAKAEPRFIRALAIDEKTLGPEHRDTAVDLTNLGGLYRARTEYVKAEPLLARALAVYEKAVGGEHPETATALNNMADLYRVQGQYAKAEPLYLRALAINEKALPPTHPNTAMSLQGLARVYQAQAQYARAEPLFVRALAVNEIALGTDHPWTTISGDDLAMSQFEAGNLAEARKTLAMSWNQRLRWLERSLRFGTDAARRTYLGTLKTQLPILISMQGTDSLLRELGLQTILVSKGRVLEETAAAIETLRQLAEPEVRERLDQLEAVRAQRGAILTAAAPGKVKELRNRIEFLNDEEDKLTAELTERSLEFRELAATSRIAELSAKLGPAALVEIIEFDELHSPAQNGKRLGAPRYGSYILTAPGGVLWQDFGPAGVIDALVRRFRYAIAVPGNEAVARDAGRQLDSLMFAPIRQALPQVKDFYIAPDGLLRLIPFAALVDGSGKPLIESYRIHMLATGRDLVRGAPVHSVQPAMVGGLAEFGRSGDGPFFPPIPGAKVEAQEVAKLIRPEVRELNDDQLTKQFLTKQVNGPRILHLATHGYYSAQTGGLALKDANLSPANILNQEEVASLRLQGTQLVVLSACETALGEVSFADGIIGLQRSLTLAGARSQILSLWPVNDAQTKDLMVAFYRNLFEKKLTKSEALRRAQLEMVRKGVDPYYWAPFVLYGDGGLLGQ
jgi:CHAT domain-containing protein/tetratricopeptide (TPR) repeat protein